MNIESSIQLEVWDYLKKGGIGFLVAVIFLIIYIFNCDKINKHIFLPICRFLRNTCLFFNKKYISKNIEFNVNSTVKKLNKKLVNYNISGISIKWVKDKDCQCLIEKNRAIIRMKKGDSQEENFVNATHLLIKNTLLYKAKENLTNLQANFIELYTTNKFCQQQGKSTEKYFYDYFYLPEKNVNPEIEKYFYDFYNIDNCGLYISIFLQEILLAGEKKVFNSDNLLFSSEIENLIHFLGKFSNRKQGEIELEKNFIGSCINFGIVLIADPQKKDINGIFPYLKYIELLINKGIKNIYLLARGNNLEFLKKIKNHILSVSHHLILINEQVMDTLITDIDGIKKVQSAILVFENKKSVYMNSSTKVLDLE